MRVFSKTVLSLGDIETPGFSGTPNISLNDYSYLDSGYAAEVISKEQPDLSLKVHQAIDLGSNMKYRLLEVVIDAVHQYEGIFYGSND